MLDFAKKYRGDHGLEGKEAELFQAAKAAGIEDNSEMRITGHKAYSFVGDATFEHEGVTYKAHGYHYDYDPFASHGAGMPWPPVRNGGVLIHPEGTPQPWPVDWRGGGISIVPGKAVPKPEPEQQEATGYHRERGGWRKEKQKEDNVPAGCVLFICAVILVAGGLAIQIANCHALPWGCF